MKSKAKNSKLTQAQKTMVFILAMSLFGMADLVTEIVPEIAFGPIELSVSYFAFIPLTLCFLFDPLYTALGSVFGEIVFADLLMGDFGGIGELEGFIELALGLYVAGLLVKDPTDKRQLGIAAFVGVGIDQMLSSIIDISKVWVGVEKLEAVPGLPKSVLVLEGISFVNEMVITGLLFGVLPTIYLAPRLYGKIEPLLGVKPREKSTASMGEFITPRLILMGIIFGFGATIAEFMSEMDINFAVWEPEFLEKFGANFIWVGVAVACIVLLISFMALNGRKEEIEIKNNN
ncbi:hypothetical protein JCM16358_23810 [Halanaerocella petrolearia]